MCVDRKCITCKYTFVSYSAEPCKSCDRHCRSNWVEALTKGTTINTTVPTKEFEVGDLVTVGYSKDIYVYLYDNIIIPVPDDITIDPPDFTIISPTTAKYSVSAGIDILKANTNDFMVFTWSAEMDKIQYATAKEIRDHNATARKDCPVFLGDWIKKRKVNNMEEKKLCTNCKYFSTAYDDEPCESCRNKSNWVDKSKLEKFKTGDLVVEKNDPMRSIKNIYIYLYDGWALRIPNYVIARSECDYVFSTYMYSLVTEDFAERIVCPKHASSEDIIGHDHRAKVFYIPETLNEWFGQLIERSPYIPHQSIIPQFGKEPEKKTKITVHHMAGARYDKYPTLNGNFIKKVIFSDPATIIFWEDGTKTVVKTQDGEEYDKEKGFAMAVCKKIFGNERDYYNVFKRWMRKGEERHEET